MEGDTEIAPHQIAFDLPETPEPAPQTSQEPELTKTVQEEENKTQAKKTEQYRPYCGEGHGKMLPSKYGGFWCPKCRG